MNSSLVMRCKNWVLGALGPGILHDRKERAMRILEEAMELAQCEGVEEGQAYNLAKRVFSRPKGEARQEMAGVYFTLLVYAWVRQFSLEDALVAELERVEDPAMIKKIREKHEGKVAQGVGRPRLMDVDSFVEAVSKLPYFKPVCGKMAPDGAPPTFQLIGGPRHWCGKDPSHAGECGAWEYGSQAEHADALNRGLG